MTLLSRLTLEATNPYAEMKWPHHRNLRNRPPTPSKGRGPVQVRIRRAFIASGAEVPVPGIGFPQHISIGSDMRPSAAFGDSSDNHRGISTRPTNRIIWLPSSRQWFAVQS
jgi:hypothetical protein